MKKKLGKAEYLERLAALELELNDMARWLQHSGPCR
jgi:polyphosphate kinase